MIPIRAGHADSDPVSRGDLESENQFGTIPHDSAGFLQMSGRPARIGLRTHRQSSIYRFTLIDMLNHNQFPVKANVRDRGASLVREAQRVRDAKQALTTDPLMPLREAVGMLGNPSYTLLQKWIKSGALRCWRVGKGQYRIRLSEVTRFLTANEVPVAEK